MSLYVLDTDILTLLQEGHPGVVQRVGSHPASEIAISVITVEEQLTGWYTRVRRAKKRDELARAYDRLARNARFLGRLTILPFPESAILRYDRLSALKLGVGKKDLRIAAITLECGGTLVTRNLRDFQRVPHLAVENWAL